MENVYPLHRFQMGYGMRRIYAEDVHASPPPLTPAHNPIRPYPYFTEKLRRSQMPLTTLPHRNPRFIPDRPTFIPHEAFNPDTWWNAEMRNRRAWVTETEKPYRDWPRMTLEHGVNV